MAVLKGKINLKQHHNHYLVLNAGVLNRKDNEI